jgi:hypothetical protein
MLKEESKFHNFNGNKEEFSQVMGTITSAAMAETLCLCSKNRWLLAEKS